MVLKEDSTESEQGRGRAANAACNIGLFLLLLFSNVGQRLTFKGLGYTLGAYPYFILLTVSGAFVVIFGAICAGILLLTGGWLPETRTWRALGAFWAIGFCNAMQGLGMVLANPHVPGHLQALLQQAVIPFTLSASVALLGARFRIQQYGGVLLILGGIALQLWPSSSQGAAASASAVGWDSGSVSWALLFLAAQLPVAMAAVLQERAFQAVPVNVFQMMFWASTAQFTTLAALAPLDAATPGAALDGLREAGRRATDGEAGSMLLGCVVTMLLAQLSQALIVKYSSAAFAVLCTALVLPASAVAFTLPLLVGARTEELSGATPVALALVFAGVLCYRLGETTVLDSDGSPSPFVESLLSSGPCTPAEPLTPGKQSVAPRVCGVGVGIIQSEYSNARASPVDLWEEGTLREAARSSSHGSLQALACGA